MFAAKPAARNRATLRLRDRVRQARPYRWAAVARRLLAAGAVGGVALGQPASAAAQRVQFRHLGVDDGLPSSLVSAVIQDRRGFMWVGTAHGVSRYDGHTFRTYRSERANLQSLAPGIVRHLYQDQRGTLWALTPAGLSRYDAERDRFVTYPVAQVLGRRLGTTPGASPDPSFTSMLAADGGTLWLGTNVGLYRFDPSTGVATPYALHAAARADGGGALAPPHVMALGTDRSGRVWVGTRSGLCRLNSDGEAPRWYRYDPADTQGVPDSVVQALAEDAAGDLWVGTDDGGLARLDTRTDRFTRFRHNSADTRSLARDRIIRLAADRAGAGVWIGTENGGLDFYDRATGAFVHHQFDPNNPSGIRSNSIWSVYQDAAGALWVGTFSGGLDISMPNGAAVHQFRSVAGDPASLSYDAVPSFAEGRGGRIWVATDGGGLNRFDPATGRFTRYTPHTSNLNSASVLGVHEDRSGDVWAATWGGGLSRLDRTGRFTAYTRANSGAHDDYLYEVVEDRRGRLWVGTNAGVVSLFDRTRGRFTRHYRVRAPGGPESSVLLIRELHDGTLAVGLREGGVTILDPETGAQTHYGADVPGASGLASFNVRALFEGEPGVLWVGTDNGLDRLEFAGARVTHYGERDGLPSAFVDGITSDGRGRLWVSTDQGLSQFDPRRRTFRNYTRSDGLHGNEFLMRSAFRAHDGTLYFGGNNGFTTIRPDLLVENTRRPPVAITDLELFNRPVMAGAPGSPLRRTISETAELTLTHAQNVVTFAFAALDFAAPEKNQYAYRLDGFDAGWQAVGHQHTASYTNLAPGRYTFRVRASNSDGVWNEDGTSIRLVVTPPVWQTWWFRLLGAAAGALGVYRLWRFQQRRRLEIALGRQALRDALTGLANRALFHDRIEHALARLARAGVPSGDTGPGIAVLFLDLDGFKLVNDSLGHHAGDELLRAVASRLLNATRGSDTVARFGGDEFAVLIENTRGPADARAVAERIAGALRAPVPLGGPRIGDGVGGREARVGVSIGIAFAEPGLDADALLRNADAAMYHAKADGKGRHAVFDPALVAAADERLALERDLADALAGGTPRAGEFALVYQPIVCLASGAITGAEALLRWHHPTRGVVSPGQFIPLAEESGLIVDLGRWVLDEACRAAAAWPPAADGSPGRAPVGVTVNVSGRQLLDPALPGHVADALAGTGLSASRLTLEITEGVLMHDTDAALAVLHALRALGVRLAIDDFGTGYSSLRYLQQFPVDVLKVDKSFVDGVARGPHDAALARTIVALGETLGLRTVAEGVEHEAQREQLAAMGCGYGQGYLFARPLDADGLLALLEAPNRNADHLGSGGGGGRLRG